MYQSDYHGSWYHASQYYQAKKKVPHDRFGIPNPEEEDELLAILIAFMEIDLDA